MSTVCTRREWRPARSKSLPQTCVPKCRKTAPHVYTRSKLYYIPPFSSLRRPRLKGSPLQRHQHHPQPPQPTTKTPPFSFGLFIVASAFPFPGHIPFHHVPSWVSSFSHRQGCYSRCAAPSDNRDRSDSLNHSGVLRWPSAAMDSLSGGPLHLSS